MGRRVRVGDDDIGREDRLMPMPPFPPMPQMPPAAAPTQTGIAIGRQGQNVIMHIGQGQLMLGRDLAISIAAALLKNADMDIAAMRTEVQIVNRLLDPEVVSEALATAIRKVLGGQPFDTDVMAKEFIETITGRKSA